MIYDSGKNQKSPLETLRSDHKLKVVTGKPFDNQRNVYLTVSFQKVVPRRYLKVPIVSRAIQYTCLWKTNHASKVKLGNHHFHLLPQNVWNRLKIKLTIYPPWKWTCPLKRDYFKRKLHLPTLRSGKGSETNAKTGQKRTPHMDPWKRSKTNVTLSTHMLNICLSMSKYPLGSNLGGTGDWGGDRGFRVGIGLRVLSLRSFTC